MAVLFKVFFVISVNNVLEIINFFVLVFIVKFEDEVLSIYIYILHFICLNTNIMYKIIVMYNNKLYTNCPSYCLLKYLSTFRLLLTSIFTICLAAKELIAADLEMVAITSFWKGIIWTITRNIFKTKPKYQISNTPKSLSWHTKRILKYIILWSKTHCVSPYYRCQIYILLGRKYCYNYQRWFSVFDFIIYVLHYNTGREFHRISSNAARA